MTTVFTPGAVHRMLEKGSLKTCRRMHRSFDSDGFNGFTKGLFVFALSGLAGFAFSVLFVIGVIIQIINYAKG